jgi:peptidoglycan/LPS O-acetylase OafA/YrhL
MAHALSFDAFQARKHMLALDGLRALAILGVLLHHTRGKPFSMFHGFRGVWVFFVLSGFLITTLALREEARAGRLDLRAFFIRRAFRILPLYYVALVAYMVWVLVLGMDPEAGRFSSHMLNFWLYTPEIPIFENRFQIPFGQAWSLGIEEKFYLVWPLLAFWLLARSQHRVVVTLALIASGCVLTARGGWLAQMWGSYTDILLGCLLALLLHQRAFYERLSTLGRTHFAWATVCLLAAATLYGGSGTQLGERLYSLVAAAAIVALVTGTKGPASIASHPWLVRVGVWSYAIYLTHPIVFDLVNPLFPEGRIWNAMTLPAMLLINLPLCWLLHISLEKPLIGVGRRLATRRPVHAVSRRIDATESRPIDDLR